MSMPLTLLANHLGTPRPVPAPRPTPACAGLIRSGLRLLVVALVAAGCRPSATNSPDLRFDLALDPSPPQVGSADVTATLADAQAKPLENAQVRLEGNMNHAGMVPTFADLEETEPGTYRGTLQFTMGGDWFILATITLPDGQRVERKIDVPGVQAR